MRPLRILHLIDTGGPGGGETVLLSLAREISKSGWESSVILHDRDWLFSQLEAEGIAHSVYPSGSSFDLGFFLSLRRELRTFRPALVHAHFLTSGVYGSVATELSHSCPLVCTFHGVPDVDPSDRFLGVKARILNRAKNRVVYVSHHLRRHLEALLGVPEGLGRVIHNGVDFKTTLEPAGLRCALGLGPANLLVGAVGNIRPAKDYANLLRAARLVVDHRADTHFVVAGGGGGTLVEELLRLRGELDLEGRVSFLGFRSDASALMMEMDVFVSSSLNEGLPLASVEAMGMGKPVVLTRCGGVPEMVEDGVTGLLVPPRDPRALAQAILAVLENTGLAERLGSTARSAIRQEFSLERMAESYQHLYIDLITRYGTVTA
jgi:glycosyltransferase involved in cell wall biosynthesis